MTVEHEGKRYETEASDLLHEGGDCRSTSMDSGHFRVYRSHATKTVWMYHSYYPSQFGPSRLTVKAGDEQVRSFLSMLRKQYVIEKIFPPLPLA